MRQFRSTSSVASLLVFAGMLSAAVPASAQNWSFDARRVALGGVGSDRNIARQMIEDEREYRAIVLPLGLIQVLRNREVFNPTSSQFDLVRSIEYAAAPIHFTLDRDGTGTGSQFVNDIRNAQLSADLNTYSGWVPVNQPVAQGLAAPSYGVTVPIFRSDNGHQGIYVGAGPYLAMRGALSVDDQLVDIWSSATPMYVPNAQMQLGTALRGQVAMAITGGYRARIASLGRGGERDGLYLAANYHYLHGFRYEDATFDLQFETDDAGMVTAGVDSPVPLMVVRDSSGSGRGFSTDIGVGVVVDRWEFGFGANGLANRIEWQDVERVSYALDNLVSGFGFTESAPELLGTRRETLPVEYVANAGYHADRWSLMGEAGHGLQGVSLHGGMEYRLGPIESRAGMYYSRERWQPSAGVGLTFFPLLALDVAVYSTDANAERKRNAAFAASLRIGR